MRLPITRQMKRVGDPLPFSMAEDFSPLDAGGEVLAFQGPVTLDGCCEYTGECFRVYARLVARYAAHCARCLQPVDAQLMVELSEEFTQQADEEHPDRYLYEGDVLDLDKMVTDQLLLNMPMRHLCREDCRGLCPVCGVDRNDHPCGCVQPEIPAKKPFAVLKDIINEEV